MFHILLKFCKAIFKRQQTLQTNWIWVLKKKQMVIYVAIGELSSQICLDKPVLSAAGASPELAWSFASGAGTFSQQSPRHSRGSRAQSRGPVAKYFHRIFNKILFSEFFLNYCSSGSGGHLVIVQKKCIEGKMSKLKKTCFILVRPTHPFEMKLLFSKIVPRPYFLGRCKMV